jgi:hypothetical protein
MSRRTKQVVYGIIYLAIIGIIVAGIYFLFLQPPPPPPPPAIPTTLQPISTLGAINVFSPLAGHATVLAQLENLNPDFAAESFSYVVTLYAADGSTTVATFPGSSFAYAAETKYIVLPNVTVPASVASAAIAVSDIQWVPAAQMGLVPQFAFTNLTTATGTNGYVTMNGDLTNRDVSLFQNIIVVAIFKDNIGTPVGASQTELDSLAPGVTQSFSISYPATASSTIDLSATELHAYAERD